MLNCRLIITLIILFQISCRENANIQIEPSVVIRGFSDQNYTAVAIVKESKIIRINIIIGYGSDLNAIKAYNKQSVFIYKDNKLVDSFLYDLDKLSLSNFLEGDSQNEFWANLSKRLNQYK